jgi:hypothetical protein
VVFGFKLDKPKHVVIAEARYNIGLAMNSEGRFMHASNCDCHKSLAAWDIDHLAWGPIKEFTKGEILNFFKKKNYQAFVKTNFALIKVDQKSRRRRSSKASSASDFKKIFNFKDLVDLPSTFIYKCFLLHLHHL